MMNGPMLPVARQCVPPQSSTENPGTVTTRTRSPYFSPNSAIAPAAMASSVDCSCVSTVWFVMKTCWFTSRSISLSWSGVTAS